jgi:hypothetical protein
MKYEIAGNCPYCDSERGINTPWAMSLEGMMSLKERHDAGHPENEKPMTGNIKFCPHCGKEIK